MKARFALILFDIDGTLVLTKGAGREATRLAMLDVFGTEAGLAAHEFGGKTDWRTLVELLAERAYGDDDMRRIMPQYERAVGRRLAEIIHRYPVTACAGALELVDTLRRRGSPVLGILTGNVSTTAPIKLRAGGFDPAWFPVGAFGSEALERDDLPALAVERAEKLTGQKISPREVIVIGDTPADISCAQALGAVAVAVRTGFSRPEALEAAQPDYLLNDLTEFLPLFEPL